MNVVDLHTADRATAGGKAAPLGELARAGFDVPRGFVVPARTYRAAATALGLTELSAAQSDLARSRLLGWRLPDEVVDDVVRALEHLTDGAPTDRVAVRSSSIAEDGADASAAGQHDSVIAVSGVEQVCRAIVECWASLWSERAVAYRTRHAPRGGETAEMAVLIQRFVDARVSGVMFTGATSVIEASRGIGERLVAGHLTPDSWRVTGSAITERRGGALCLTDSEVMGLAALGAEISAALGGPWDIEWAIADGTIWVLQARPVTAPVPDSVTRQHPRAGAATLTGEPASPGIASGPVRLVRGPSDFPLVEPGDVIVCRHTDPAWTPLFTIAAAVATEIGGVLSHAAIVAREVGIPAVLAVPRATDLLPPLARVVVDGDTGQIIRKRA